VDLVHAARRDRRRRALRPVRALDDREIAVEPYRPARLHDLQRSRPLPGLVDELLGRERERSHRGIRPAELDPRSLVEERAEMVPSSARGRPRERRVERADRPVETHDVGGVDRRVSDAGKERRGNAQSRAWSDVVTRDSTAQQICMEQHVSPPSG
jgi:hypothetical protein